MWSLGLIIGALIGGAIGSLIGWDEAWLAFAALGAIAGILHQDKRPQTAAPRRTDELERRVSALEREVQALKLQPRSMNAASSAETVRQGEQPASTRVVTPPPEGTLPAGAAISDSASAPVPASPLPAQPAPFAREPKAPLEPSWVWQKLFGGNILAKVGVVLLFFGIASGLKLAVDFGVFPASVRLLMATVGGIAMIGFGFSRMGAPQHRMFGLALQGGGFGVLYLVAYFALSWHGYIGHATAFAIFAALGIACLVVAVHFEGEPLAILGISGAFFAPLLASTGAGSHVVLFSYYAVLTALVLGVNWLRAWRALTVTAFGFTMVIGMRWASMRFAPEFFASTEAFLILFLVLFSLAPFMSAVMKRAQHDHWADTVLLFGTPIAALVAQSWLVDKAGYGDTVLAWSAVGAGLYYSALTVALFLRQGLEQLRPTHGAIAVAFYTAAVPLAFGVQVTSAFWAIEGLALAWFGVTNGRGLAYAAGLLLQLVAGAYFIVRWNEPRAMPILNGLYVGCVIIVGCGAATAWSTKRRAAGWLGGDVVQAFSALAGAWALLWWLGANFSEVSRFTAGPHEMTLHIGVLIGTAWALMAIGKALPWTGARYTGLLLAAIALLGDIFNSWLYTQSSHPLHDTMFFAVPAAFATVYAILRSNERDGLRALSSEAHVYALLVLAYTLVREALWMAGELAPGVPLWRLLAWQLVPTALVYGLLVLDRQRAWPLAAQRGAYLAAGAPALLTVAVLAALYANFNQAGGGTGLPYLPVASLFDLAQIAVIFTVFAWARLSEAAVRPTTLRFARHIATGLGLVWVSAMAMRLAHHWGGVKFDAAALLASGLAQSTLSLLWTAFALTLMISATRKVMRQRWFMGFALLGVVGVKFMLIDVVNKGTVTWTLSLIGVGLLILAASYFSPAPPRATSAPAAPAP